MGVTARNRENGIVQLYFNHGAYVAVQDVGGTKRGYIECEMATKPGFYYVRDEKTKLLFQAQWQRMRLIGPDESPSA